ncbi:MAG: hypothetical protein ACI8W8_000441 [Rhodothermales bacterium]|jgi:hypothetical protein
MFATILILVGAGLGVGIGFLLGKGPISRAVAVVGALVALAGGVLAAHQSKTMLDALNRQGWPTVDGEVVDTYITLANEPMITYRYTVDGTQYEGKSNMHAPGFGLNSHRLETAHTILSDLAKEPTVPVFYNPDAPAEAKVKPGPSWRVFTRVSFGFCLLVLGCVGLTRGVRVSA